VKHVPCLGSLSLEGGQLTAALRATKNGYSWNMLLPEAEAVAKRALEQIRATFPELRDVTQSGRLRRGCPLIEEVTVGAVADVSTRWPKSQFIPQLGVRLVVCDPAHRGIALLFTTGSQEHLERLRSLAAARGLRLTDAGLWTGPREILCPTEEAAYAALGLPFIEPELREGLSEVELALDGRLPTLLGEEQIKGVLHNHTNLSDGTDSLEQLAEAARAKGYGYLGLADHFPGTAASGTEIAGVEAQCQHVDELNARFGPGFRIFKGVELGIPTDGALDIPEVMLSRLDYIVCGIHSHYGLDRAAQTARLIRALRNPHVFMLSHPSSRLLPDFHGTDVDMEAVLRACATFGVVVEINAHPRRLDLDWRWHQAALDMDCLFCISPDAHSASRLDDVRFGIAVARKGGIPAERVLNCADAERVAAMFEARQQQARRR